MALSYNLGYQESISVHPKGVRILLANHTRISPTSENDSYAVGTDKTLSGPNFGNMGQGLRATMHKVVQEGLSYLTFIVEKSLLEFSPKNLSKERMGKWWIHQPSRILLSCTTNTQFL